MYVFTREKSPAETVGGGCRYRPVQNVKKKERTTIKEIR